MYLLLPIFFVSAAAIAAPRTSLPLVRTVGRADVNLVDYVAPAKGLAALKLPLDIMVASPKIESLDKNDRVVDWCSSSVVSDTGNILLAGHCVENCLRAAGLVYSEQGIDVIATKSLDTVTCSMKVNGQKTEYSILAISPCSQIIAKMDNENFAQKCKSLDYAIVKPKVSIPSLSKCMHISASVPPIGSSIAAVGFPPATVRAGLKKSTVETDGKSQMLTTGKTLAFQNRCFRDVDADNISNGIFTRGDVEFSGEPRNQILKREVGSGRLIQTTADVLPGMSGGGLVDFKSGAVVGVAQFLIENDAGIFCAGDGFFGSMAAIVKDLKDNYSNLDLANIFRCEKNGVMAAPADVLTWPQPNTAPVPLEQQGVE